MKKRTLIVILGLLIAIVPLLGLPSSWKNWIVIVLGICVAFLAAIRKRIYVAVPHVESEKTLN